MASNRRKETPITHDWDELFAEWVKSGLKKKDFLKKKGINVHGMIARRKTEGWHLDVAKARDILKTEDSEVDMQMAVIESVANENPPKEALKEIWQIVQQWREKQAENDYKLADIIRIHAKVLLKTNLIYKSNQEGSEEVFSKLKPNDLLAICKVAETVQRIQRLALGLSTENIGVDSGAKADIDNVPVFEVQVNADGKFVSIR
jgi:hypothetical protein